MGIDPSSSEIRLIEKDVVTAGDGHKVTLNALAAKGDRQAIKQFVATRDFIHRFEIDSKNTSFTSDGIYNVDDLTAAEPAFV
ncbi:MAG: hypothetical protein B7Z81_14880, partial [Acidocella sp. 20-61-6]